MKYIKKIIKEYQSVDKALLVIFYTSVIALPSNLSKTWRLPLSYFQGIFYEYWAPKLFVSQLLLLLLLLSYLFVTIKNSVSISAFFASTFSEAKNRLFREKKLLIILIFGIIILGQALLQPHPERFLTWLATLAFGPLILLYIAEKDHFLRHFPQAVIISTTLQSFLSLYQYFFQKSLAGYHVLGETQLSRMLFLAKSTLRSEVITLPYGTTPHPNILAGWLLLGITALLIIRKRMSIKVFLPILSLHLLALFLTESLSAWASLSLVLIFFSQSKVLRKPLTRGKKVVIVFITFLNAVAWTLLPVALSSFWPGHEVPLSITRRARPIEELIIKHPTKLFYGAGLGQSFPELNSSESQQNLWKYPQPLHNSGIILVFEMGFCILLLLFIYFIFVLNNYSLLFLFFILNIPILYLDHYLTTQIVGQYIFISYYLFFVYLNKKY